MDNVTFRRRNRLKKHFVITSNVRLKAVDSVGHMGQLETVGCQYSIRIWESGEWQTRTAECRQRGANPLPGKQMVVGLKRKRLGEMPSLPQCICVLERGTGFEPATSCLEGRSSTAELPPLG
jgi:hypothetical protein